MSFFLTTEQIRRREKTVTRRLGWQRAKAGEIVQPILKGQGLKAGERVEKIGGPIRFVKVSREVLSSMPLEDCAREGFPQMTPAEFVSMFVGHNSGCNRRTIVTRIEFEYVEGAEA